MVGRTAICIEHKRKLTLNVLLPIYMNMYAFITHVTNMKDWSMMRKVRYSKGWTNDSTMQTQDLGPS